MNDKKDKPRKFFTIFTIINIVVFLSAILISVYFFYIKKDFNFIVETSCDPNVEQCFYRDCSNPDDCPANLLSSFKKYTLRARDFKYCENEDCSLACKNKLISCTELACEENMELGESCLSLYTLNTK